MEKKIIIGDNELQVRSSLFTIIEYKTTFGSDLFSDVTKLSNSKENEISSIIQILFQIIYVLHKPYEAISFEEFLNKFDFSLLGDSKALEDITNIIGELLGSVKDAPKGTTKTP